MSHDSTPHPILALTEARDPRACGGKAANLARLMDLGIAVPSGFVVTTPVFDRYLEHGGLRELRTDAVARLRARPGEDVSPVLRLMDARADAQPLPDSVYGAVAEQLAGLPPEEAMIVRSSGLGEDSSRASFAGQLQSIRDLNTADDVLHAIRQCWKSFWSLRVLSYEVAHRTTLSGLAVIVQRQVRSSISGVLFTRSPDRKQASQGLMLCEYCSGSGESLADGSLTPESVCIPCGHPGPLSASPAPPEDRSTSTVLDAELTRDLRLAAQAIENCFGRPQDIEWTADQEGRLYIVQSRPITATFPRGEARHILWSNANINENFPDPVSPLLYSIARDGYSHYFRNLGRAFGVTETRLRSVDDALRNVVGAHGGRLFYNLSNIHNALTVTPIGPWLSRAFDGFVGTDGSSEFEAPREPRRTGDVFRLLFEASRAAVFTSYQYLGVSYRVAKFEAAVDQFAHGTTPVVMASKTPTQMHHDFLDFLDVRFRQWTNAGLADTAAMACSALLLQVLRRYCGEENAPQRLTELIMGLPGLVSRGPAEDLWDLAMKADADEALRTLFLDQSPARILSEIRSDPRWGEFEKSLNHYLGRWGYRCSRELMLTTPSFSERPEDLLAIMKIYVSARPRAPAEVAETQARARERATDELLQTVRSRGWISGRIAAVAIFALVKASHAAIGLRERVRLKQALLYGRLRLLVLEIGGHLASEGVLDAKDDIFFLTYQEIDALLSGTSLFPYGVPSQIQSRRSDHELLSRMSVPDTFTLPRGQYLRPDVDTPGGDAATSSPAGELVGEGACPGSITARAAIVDDVANASRLAAGDVLVTRQTDPGWASVLYLVSGLVTERGGLLSHGAIVAREFGIPAVVGVEGATQHISHGSKVYVDGTRGIVRPMA